MLPRTKREIVKEAARHKGILTMADLLNLGVSKRYITDLVAQGTLIYQGRNAYVSPDFKITEHHSLVEAVRQTSKAVVCLLSALQFHGIGNQSPPQVWIALPRHAHSLRSSLVEIQIVRMSQPRLSTGVENHVIEGVPVKIFSLAKTVTDCFRFRSTIGSEVAIEVLSEVLRKRLVTTDDLYSFAITNKVWNIMLPYIEALS